MASYNEIAFQCGTDKAYDLERGWHGYMNYYEAHLRGRSPKRILEIGAAGGCSLRMWEIIFPEALIVGVDIDPRSLRTRAQRAVIEMIDAKDLRPLVQKYHSFDFIVDDGSHIAEEIFAALNVLWDTLEPGGLYVIEDMYCESFDPVPKCTREELLATRPKWQAFCGRIVDWILLRGDVARMTVHQCVLTLGHPGGQCIIFLEKSLEEG